MIDALREVEVADPLWSQYVEAQPTATAFHRPAWARLVADCYGYRASALMLSDANGETLGGLPVLRVRRPLLGEQAISLPFTDSCAPLTTAADTLANLAHALADWRKRTRPAGLPLLVRSPLPEVEGWVQRQVAVLHTLQLSPDADKVFRTFKRTQVQQCIVKAERDGVVVRRGESFADLRVFYDLHLHTRQRLGAPVQPLRFFRLIWERLLSTGLGFVLLAWQGTTPVAGSVFLAWNGTLIYKYSASDSAFWRLRPNHLVLWTAIRWACENGMRVMDFGRTDLENRGLRDFKNGWGTQELPLTYSALAQPRGASSGALQARVSRGLSAFIRRSPPWVCRAVGELAYRYAT